ncbi:MAG: heavy metal translocating P-type ATPase [Candidatus Harrisonbacteria bacterium]|nr:heavy metal translocating P-type ATPase [Candidatus Harrisonbacteria bacterium]
MHPEIQRQKPGLCPECGMKLVPAERKEGKSVDAESIADKHAGHSTQMFLRKFWISLALTIPVVLYSELPARFLGWQAPAFLGSDYIQLALSTIVFFYGGWIFTRGAWLEVKGRLPGMMTLIGIAIWAAYIYSVLQILLIRLGTITGEPSTLFWELTSLITIMLLGHWIEMRSVQGAQRALKELSKLLPDTAEILMKNDKTKIVPISELRVDNVVLVRPGGKIPADGMIIDGSSDINEAMVTGESKPVAKKKNDEVIAGTINGDGSLKVRITKIGENTFLSGVMRLVEEAQASKSRIQILSDRAAFYLTIIAIVSGLSSFWYWIFVGAGAIFALERFVAVLVIACPHALGLAVPLVASISTTKSAQNGLLVRQRLALEAARKIDVVLFDKTGTLTRGEYGIDKIIPNPQFPIFKFALSQFTMPRRTDIPAAGYQLLQFAASVDNRSEHFASKAIVKEAERLGVELLPVENFERLPGKGVRGVVKSITVAVGGEKILKEFKAEIPEELKSQILDLARQGKTINYVIIGDQPAGVIVLADIIREESKEAVKELKNLGVRTAMLTGDSEEVAHWVANELQIDEYFARVLPEDKVDRVKRLQSRALKVAMVGDGINDAPALTQADLGIAIGAGTNVAIESAGIILVRNDPRDIVKIIKLSRLTYNKMIQNLFWATGYNLIALPLAAGVLVSKGILLQPAISAVFMSLSTVIVAVNAILLRRHRL